MEFLEKSIWQYVAELARCLCMMVVAFAILKIIHRVAISRLSSLPLRRYSNRRLLVSMLKQNQILILLIACYLASYALTLNLPLWLMAESSRSDLNFTGRTLASAAYLLRLADASKTDDQDASSPQPLVCLVLWRA